MSAPNVSIPKTNFTQQLKQTLKGYQATAGGFLGLNKEFAPQYTDLNLNTLRQTLFGSANAPGELPIQSQALTYTRGSDIADIMRYGRPGYDALMQSNPGLALTLGTADREGAGVFAPGSLMDTLRRTAGSQLALGGSLSPQEGGALDQVSRAGYADRGLATGNQSLAAELLNRDSAMNARLGQRIGWASNVEQLAGQDRSQLNQLAGINASVYDPSQQVIARGSSSLGGLLGGGAVPPGALMGTGDTSRLYNPQGGQDAFNTNVNAQATAALANANNSAASTNGLIGAGASIVGGAIIAI